MIGSLLPEWVGLALTPLAIVGTVVLLSTERPLANSLSFCVSFGVVYAIVSTIAIAIGSAADAGEGGESNAHDVVSLVVGLLFLCVAIALILRPVKRRKGPPGWSKSLASATPRKIFVTGAAASLINPNVAILFSGLTILITTSIPTSEQFGWAATLVLASLVPFLVPIGAYVMFGDRSKKTLDRVLHWMIEHDRVITIGSLLLFGVIFAGRGLVGLW